MTHDKSTWSHTSHMVCMLDCEAPRHYLLKNITALILNLDFVEMLVYLIHLVGPARLAAPTE